MLVLLGQSTSEPVTVAEARTYLRLESTDSTAEDLLIGSYITAARLLCENITKRALVPSTWQLIIDHFENATEAVDLPRPPLSTISTLVSISYVQDTTAGTSTTIGSTVYTVDPNSNPARVYPSFGNEWPTGSIRSQRNAVTIQYVSGYTTANVPAPIKLWIQQRAAQMYENREPIVLGQTIENLPRQFVDGLLDPYMVLTATT